MKEPVEVERLIVPEMSYKPYFYYNHDFERIIEKIVSNCNYGNLIPHEKVYFSRGKFANKVDYGERALITLFERNGYYIVYPEEHTFQEQVFYVNTCRFFASVGGSCAHNIVFSRSKPQVIILSRFGGYQTNASIFFK